MARGRLVWFGGLLSVGLLAVVAYVGSPMLQALTCRIGTLLILASLPLALLLVSCGAASAEPRTLYRPADIENARENTERYDWAREIVEGWRSGASFALSQDRALFEAMIPDLTPGTTYGQNCPHCVDKQSLMGNGRFDWSIERPDEVACAVCGTVYPNPDYPEDFVIETDFGYHLVKRTG